MCMPVMQSACEPIASEFHATAQLRPRPWATHAVADAGLYRAYRGRRCCDRRPLAPAPSSPSKFSPTLPAVCLCMTIVSRATGNLSLRHRESPRCCRSSQPNFPLIWTKLPHALTRAPLRCGPTRADNRPPPPLKPGVQGAGLADRRGSQRVALSRDTAVEGVSKVTFKRLGVHWLKAPKCHSNPAPPHNREIAREWQQLAACLVHITHALRGRNYGNMLSPL
jgi:hypothetical protein